MSMDLARECVARGADLLDREYPAWWAQIDLEKLDIAESDVCALGQLFDESRVMPRWKRDRFDSLEAAVAASSVPVGAPDWRRVRVIRSYSGNVCVANYDLGLHVLGLAEEESGFYGFNEYFTHDDAEWADYAELDEAWREVIELRQRSLSSIVRGEQESLEAMRDLDELAVQ